VSAAPFPAYEQATETVVPGVGALDDPAPRFAAYLSDQRRLAATSDVRSNSAKSKRRSDVRVVVALVETQVFGAPGASRAAHDDGVEHLADDVRIRHVRAGDERGDGHAASVGQDVPFDAAFRAVRRVWPREVPPFGAFTEALSSELHFSAAPRRPW
jgi:hypothetical protein